MSSATATSLLNRLLDPVGRSLNGDAARQLVALRADAATQRRVGQLARKCNEGRLSPEERAEYESYVWASSVIAILQAKARLALHQDR